MILLAWLTSLVATLGSLFFSEVMEFVPCSLCWYQRIAMYPIVIILGTAMWKDIKNISTIAFPLSIIGQALSIYHLGVQYDIIPEAASPCIQGIPCSSMYIQWLGFITIPFLSFIAFALINFFLWKSDHEK
ncbi:MAG: disulfide bond formation protein B [Bdellovibrionales bacterium CG11_big_fil_rev_8_21_14_0_20_38_13]|nr:MAG: disulfide bond formation protein B [Bdellovibrionales bacterium CG22_combo_CG10-13_8_21_14_all_38_13]PIR28329.1 MAG: disulfide bond formation protein B [Bdellovibrionales bacterium CG11_big_fil_rev_8_21_14_0_20_38_13]